MPDLVPRQSVTLAEERREQLRQIVKYCKCCGKQLRIREATATQKAEENNSYERRKYCDRICAGKGPAHNPNKGQRRPRRKAVAPAPNPYMKMTIVTDRSTNY